MLFTLENWKSYEVDMPETSHTYEEILSELKEKNIHEFNHLIRLVKEWPQTKQVVPYFYDHIFSTNYKDAETNFIKWLLKFSDTFEAQEILFSLIDITWWLWLPRLIWKEYNQWLIEAICEMVWNINEFWSWYNNCWLMSWKQIRDVLLDCQKSENPLETWKKRIPEVEYFSDKVSKLYEKYPELWDRVLYEKIDELKNF